MGNCCGGKQAVAPGKRDPPSNLELRIQKALQFIVEQRQQAALRRQPSATSMAAGGGDMANFNRIILKFPTIRAAFASIRKVFHAFDEDKNGVIDKDELKTAMETLGATLTDAELAEMFEEMSMSSSSQGLNFREFLLCLSIGSVLQLFPLMKAYSSHELPPLETKDSDVGSSQPMSARSSASMTEGSGLYLRGQKLVKALQHVLEAYVLFDADASGTIDKEEVLHMVAEKGAKGGGNMASALLSEERWAELDWDKDGKITFVEFLYAFEAWVGVDDEDSDESDGDGADLILPTASSGAAAALALDAPSPESPQGAGATTTAAVGPATGSSALPTPQDAQPQPS